MIIKPKIPDILQFITQTHEVEANKQGSIVNPIDPGHKIEEVNFQTAEDTLNKKKQNPFVHGHLAAIFYSIDKLLDTSDYPARSLITLSDLDNNAQWLKYLNNLALSPLIQPCNFELTKIGTWRTDLASNLLTPAPSPFILPIIMFNWLTKLKSIHDRVKPNIDNPYGISKEDYKIMTEFTNDVPLFFSTVQPFTYANNRFGRLIQNIVRMGWNMPILFNIGDKYDQFKIDLDIYQRTKLPEIVKQANLDKNKHM